MSRWVFRGHIAGVGTAEGTRLVLGRWAASPFGPFADVMMERPDGLRVLLAPTEPVAEFVAGTYRFDQVVVAPVWVAGGPLWRVRAGPLAWDFIPGRRTSLGWLLRLVPARLGRTLTWARVTDRIAPRLLPGVRTLGSAGQGRREWYAATDLHRITGSSARWDGTDLGALAAVDPPPRFGFGSTPRTPSLARVVSTVEV